MSLWDHHAAVINDISSRGATVYDSKAGRLLNGKTVDPDEAYAVVISSAPTSSTEHIMHDREKQEIDVTVQIVGRTPREAMAVVDAVEPLAGKRLPVPGRQVVVESVVSANIRQDTDNPENPLWSGVAGFTLHSFPA